MQALVEALLKAVVEGSIEVTSAEAITTFMEAFMEGFGDNLWKRLDCFLQLNSSMSSVEAFMEAVKDSMEAVEASMKAFMNLHAKPSSAGDRDDEHSEWFDVTQGLWQGRVLSPLLFRVFFAAAIHVVLVRFSKDPDILRDLVDLKKNLREDAAG